MRSTGSRGINPDDLKVVKADANLQVLLRPTNTTGYVAFNYKVKEFQDKRVRQAIAHAINKKAIVDALYGGTGLVATQFQPPPLWGYNKELKDYEYSTGQGPGPPEAGRASPNGFSEITWEDGKKEPLVFWYMSRSRPVLPEPEGDRRGHRRRPRQGRDQGASSRPSSGRSTSTSGRTASCRSTCSGGPATTAIPTTSSATSSARPSASREGFYSNPPLSDLLKRAQTLTSQTERAKLYRQAEQMIHDDVARMFIANNEPPLAFSKKVKGYVPNPTRRRALQHASTIQ